jgi:recombination protein RecT
MNAKKKKTEVEKAEPTYSQRFTSMVVTEFGSTVGTLALTPFQMKLAQHLFIGIDAALKSFEADRLAKNQDKKTPVVWSNINMEKLAIDAVNRIELGLDALIPGHIYPIPYMNSKTKKYDLDLRVGYVGKDYYRRRFATEEPKDIIYALVHETDDFTPDMTPGAETYTLKITNPFDRGAILGGFGYIVFEDASKNKLIMVSKADFDKSKKKAQTDKFWGPYEKEMQFKTLINRVTSHLQTDPEKVNASFAAVEMDDNEAEISAEANQGPIVDLGETEYEVKTDQEPEAEEEPEPETEKPQENPKLAFQKNITQVANEIGARKYTETLKECGYDNIHDVKPDHYEMVEKKFNEAVDKMNAGEEKGPEEPGF